MVDLIHPVGDPDIEVPDEVQAPRQNGPAEIEYYAHYELLPRKIVATLLRYSMTPVEPPIIIRTFPRYVMTSHLHRADDYSVNYCVCYKLNPGSQTVEKQYVDRWREPVIAVRGESQEGIYSGTSSRL